MKKQTRTYIILLVGLLIVVFVGLRWRGVLSNPATNEQNEKRQGNQSAVSASADPARQSAPSKLETGKALESTFDAFKKAGLREYPPVAVYLQEAVSSRDNGKILRAFHDAYFSKLWRLSDAVPAIKSFLNDPNPFVRLTAAHDLYVVGDSSGHDVLLSLIQTRDPVPGIEGGRDTRIEAALVLAQFGQTDAIKAISGLYSETHSAELSQAMAELGAQLPDQDRLPFVSSALAITEYAKAGVSKFIPQITSVFQTTSNSRLKNAAAWALVTMTGDSAALDYLIQTAQTSVNQQSPENRELLKYLGSIEDARVKSLLETSLASQDQVIVQTAITNLIYNQGGSEKAVQIIVDQLTDYTHPRLPWDFTLNVASQLQSDQRIQAAAKIFSQNDTAGDWKLYAVERKNWPIANWVGPYVAKVKK